MANVERVVVKRHGDRSWFVHQAANGRIFSTSETYSRHADAVRAAEDAHPELPLFVAPAEPDFVEP